MNQELKERLARIRLLACDFDGVFTDGFVYTDQDGREMVRSSRRDSWGVRMLKKAGVEVVVISFEANPVVTKRCEKIGVRCWQKVQGAGEKADILRMHAESGGYQREEIAYVGDDLNDLEALQYAGVAVTVADGHESLKKIAHVVTVRKGGEHAVREICDLILAVKNQSVSV